MRKIQLFVLMLAATLAAQAQVTLYAYRNTQLDDVQNAKKGTREIFTVRPLRCHADCRPNPAWMRLRRGLLQLQMVCASDQTRHAKQP